MADDDEQTVALEPDQREQGDDDSPEALERAAPASGCATPSARPRS